MEVIIYLFVYYPITVRMYGIFFAENIVTLFSQHVIIKHIVADSDKRKCIAIIRQSWQYDKMMQIPNSISYKQIHKKHMELPYNEIFLQHCPVLYILTASCSPRSPVEFNHVVLPENLLMGDSKHSTYWSILLAKSVPCYWGPNNMIYFPQVHPWVRSAGTLYLKLGLLLLFCPWLLHAWEINPDLVYGAQGEDTEVFAHAPFPQFERVPRGTICSAGDSTCTDGVHMNFLKGQIMLHSSVSGWETGMVTCIHAFSPYATKGASPNVPMGC